LTISGTTPANAALIDRPEKPRDLAEQRWRLRLEPAPLQGPSLLDRLAQETAILERAHPGKMIGQGPVPARHALRRIVLRVLPAERPQSQPFGELGAEKDIVVGRPSSRSRRRDGPLHPAVQDC
jgi:hypothetical protein